MFDAPVHGIRLVPDISILPPEERDYFLKLECPVGYIMNRGNIHYSGLWKGDTYSIQNIGKRLFHVTEEGTISPNDKTFDILTLLREKGSEHLEEQELLIVHILELRKAYAKWKGQFGAQLQTFRSSSYPSPPNNRRDVMKDMLKQLWDSPGFHTSYVSMVDKKRQMLKLILSETNGDGQPGFGWDAELGSARFSRESFDNHYGTLWRVPENETAASSNGGSVAHDLIMERFLSDSGEDLRDKLFHEMDENTKVQYNAIKQIEINHQEAFKTFYRQRASNDGTLAPSVSHPPPPLNPLRPEEIMKPLPEAGYATCPYKIGPNQSVEGLTIKQILSKLEQGRRQLLNISIAGGKRNLENIQSFVSSKSDYILPNDFPVMGMTKFLNEQIAMAEQWPQFIKIKTRLVVPGMCTLI